MPIRAELGEMIGKIQNTIEVYKEDSEASEFEEFGYVIPKLERAVKIFQSYMPALTAVEDLLFGDTTPKIFMKKWKVIEQANADYDVNEITPDVKDFLSKMSGNKDEGETA